MIHDKKWGSDNILDVIKFLRLPLILGVVLIHAYLFPFDIANGEYGYTIMGGIQYFLSQVIGRGCTSIFFCFSGFLFFYNVDVFSFHAYASKIKRRLKTLVIPYLIWNLLFLLAYSLGQIFLPNMMHGGLVQGINKMLYQYTFHDWIVVLFGSGHYRFPCNFPLWYIRDLFIVVLCSPVLYRCLKMSNNIGRQWWSFLFFIVLGVLWILKVWEGIPQTRAFFFFSMGAYFSINKKNIIVQEKVGIVLTALFILLASIQMLFPAYLYIDYIHRIAQIVEVYVIIFWASQYLYLRQINLDNACLKSSLMIYVYHVFPLIAIQRVLYVFLPSDNQWCALTVYLGSTLLVIFMGVLINTFIHRYFPSITAFILGER